MTSQYLKMLIKYSTVIGYKRRSYYSDEYEWRQLKMYTDALLMKNCDKLSLNTQKEAK